MTQSQQPDQTPIGGEGNSSIPDTGVAAAGLPGVADQEKVVEKLAEKLEQREPRKPAIRILEQQITAGLTEIERSTEVLAGLFSGQGITFLDYLHLLFWTTLGNLIGGVFFVAVLKYGQAITSNRDIENVNID